MPFHFLFIFLTCFTQIPQMGIFVKQFPLIFPLFPDVGEIDFPAREFCFPNETQFPNFPPISPEFPLNFPRIHPISKRFLLIPPDSPVSWKSDEKLFIFSLVFPGVKCISLLGKSNSPNFFSGYRENR